jgi:hypothetical protein
MTGEAAEVVAPYVFADEELEPSPPNATDRIEVRFQKAPVTVERLRMDIATDIFTSVMVDPLMEIAVARKSSVSLAAICVDGTAVADNFLDAGDQRAILGVGHKPDAYLGRIALHDPEYGLFAGSSASFSSLTTDVDRLVLP